MAAGYSLFYTKGLELRNRFSFLNEKMKPKDQQEVKEQEQESPASAGEQALPLPEETNSEIVEPRLPEILLPAAQNSDAMFTRESNSKVMDSVVVHNEKVRYYYNKTLYLRGSLENMLEMLEKVHTTTFAYLSQLPETGDYSIIGTLFDLIPTLNQKVDWRQLNHYCYWDDFCRETKQLVALLEKVNGAVLKCSDTSTYNLSKAQDLFKGLVNGEKNALKIDRAIAHRQATDYVSEDTGAQNIQIEWKKPGDVISLSWHDPDGGLLNVALNDTGVGFRIRLLRHVIYHARTCLENALATFMKINIVLHLHIPIEKLEKCKDVDLSTLSLQEKAYLVKAKREFDASLDKIWKMVSRFKYQALNLLKFKETFKKMRKSLWYTPKNVPTFVTLKMSFDDSLLMRVMSSGIQAQAKQESFDFTVHPDRTEDITAIVEDLMGTATNGFKELQTTLAIIKGTLPVEKERFSEKEKRSTGDEIRVILAHRYQIRKALKKANQILEGHSAFQQMDKLKLYDRPPTSSSKKGSGDSVTNQSEPLAQTIETPPDQNQNPPGPIEPKNSDQNNNEDRDALQWISLEGGVKVALDALRGILAQCPFTQTIKPYKDLSSDEKIILTIRLIRQLLVLAANEQSSAKILLDRVMETKSLVKRLKPKDRLAECLQNVVLEQHKQLDQMLNLTKSMRFLRKYT